MIYNLRIAHLKLNFANVNIGDDFCKPDRVKAGRLNISPYVFLLFHEIGKLSDCFVLNKWLSACKIYFVCVWLKLFDNYVLCFIHRKTIATIHCERICGIAPIAMEMAPGHSHK